LLLTFREWIRGGHFKYFTLLRQATEMATRSSGEPAWRAGYYKTVQRQAGWVGSNLEFSGCPRSTIH
jgi:hypothetical protein